MLVLVLWCFKIPSKRLLYAQKKSQFEARNFKFQLTKKNSGDT